MELQPWLDILNARFLAALLIFIRLGGVLVATPLLNNRSIPMPVKVGLSGVLALTLAPLSPPVMGLDLPFFVLAAGKEALLGLLLGWITSLVFAAVQMAGEWLDLQGGFQAGAIFNPTFDTQSAPLSSFTHVLAGLVFFVTGGYAMVLRAAAASLQISPPGSLRINAGTPELWMPLVAQSFWLAIQIAAPVAGALFLAEIAVALANRAMPQMHLTTLTLPAKGLLAVGLLAMTIPAFGRILESAFRELGTDLVTVMRWVGG